MSGAKNADWPCPHHLTSPKSWLISSQRCHLVLFSHSSALKDIQFFGGWFWVNSTFTNELQLQYLTFKNNNKPHIGGSIHFSVWCSACKDGVYHGFTMKAGIGGWDSASLCLTLSPPFLWSWFTGDLTGPKNGTNCHPWHLTHTQGRWTLGYQPAPCFIIMFTEKLPFRATLW
jgi:hypothetical protein